MDSRKFRRRDRSPRVEEEITSSVEEDGGVLVERRVDREVVEEAEVEGEDGGEEREDEDVVDEVVEEILVSLDLPYLLGEGKSPSSTSWLRVSWSEGHDEKSDVATDRRVSLPYTGPRPPTAAAQP